jgi:hypothetical protein
VVWALVGAQHVREDLPRLVKGGFRECEHCISWCVLDW